jgi:hypothetical protein
LGTASETSSTYDVDMTWEKARSRIPSRTAFTELDLTRRSPG